MRKFFYFSSLYVILMIFSSCMEGSSIGESIQPGQDVIHTDTATFQLTTQTVLVDSILQKNSTAILGEYTDARFGTTKADFMAQLYCPPNYTFDAKNIINDRIDSVFLYLFFDEWYGDSTSLFETSVYQLTSPIDLDIPYYTNINVDDYCDKSILLGSVSYTVEHSKNTWTDAYDYCVRIPLDTAFAQKIYHDNQDSVLKACFTDSRAFARYFNGLYITTRFGNSCFLYIDNIQMEMCYDYQYLDTAGVYVDTVAATNFLATKEVKQINTYNHPDLSAYVPIENSIGDSLNYIYSPAGMFTEVDLPMESICQRLSEKNVNHARLKIAATDLDDSDWGMNPPQKLLLIRDQDIHSFFGEYNLSDDLYSFVAKYDNSNECFIFDLGVSIQKSIRYADGDLDSTSSFEPYSKMLIIPVEEITNDDDASLYLLPETKPTAVKIKSAVHPNSPMKLELVYSNSEK